MAEWGVRLGNDNETIHIMVKGSCGGSPNHKTGADYRIRIRRVDREKHFKKSWPRVILELEGGMSIEVNLSPSFWTTCIQLRSKWIGKWMLDRKLAPWRKNDPPELRLERIGNRAFRLKE